LQAGGIRFAQLAGSLERPHRQGPDLLVLGDALEAEIGTVRLIVDEEEVRVLLAPFLRLVNDRAKTQRFAVPLAVRTLVVRLDRRRTRLRHLHVDVVGDQFVHIAPAHADVVRLALLAAPHTVREFVGPYSNARGGHRAIVIEALHAMKRRDAHWLGEADNHRAHIDLCVAFDYGEAAHIDSVDQYPRRCGAPTARVAKVEKQHVSPLVERSPRHPRVPVPDLNRSRDPATRVLEGQRQAGPLGHLPQPNDNFAGSPWCNPHGIDLPPDGLAQRNEPIHHVPRQIGEVDARRLAVLPLFGKNDHPFEADTVQQDIFDRQRFGRAVLEVDMH